MSENNNQGVAPAWPWAALPDYRADYRRRNPVPDPPSVLSELADRPQWLVWGYRPGETEEKKYRKMPHYADGGRRFSDQGSDKDRKRLVTLVDAVAAVSRGDFDGVGFAFLPDDGLIGIDLDGMIDPETGEISERCEAIIDACDSYTELSPSGKGVHIFCAQEHAEGLRTFKSNKVGVEVFIGAQFFTFTGRVWPGASLAINPMPPRTLARLKATVEAGKVKPAAASEDPPAPANIPASPDGFQRSLAQTVALAEEALTFIDPSDYEEWIAIGQACRASLGAAGYALWDAWSSRAPNYAGAADTEKRWKTFKGEMTSVGAIFKKAEAAGWESPWLKAKKRKATRPARKAPAAKNAPAGDGAPSDDPPPEFGEVPPDHNWERDLISKKGELSSCLANAELILSHAHAWTDVIAYDEFSERTVFRKPLPFDPNGPAAGEWSDHLDVKATIWMQRTWRVEFSPMTVGKAVESMARDRKYHPVREALAKLAPWDGISRNGDWLSDFLGVVKTEYTQLVGKFFLRGMIQRVMRPGCKFDYALVLEGEQGRGKSTVARLLAWHWFCDTDLDLSNKDSLLALPGHWVYEIAELGSLMKAEERKQKSFLSRQEDEFRPPYGQRLIKVPRQNVFIGTTNEEEYLKDATGGRRFWPIMCGDEFNLDGLRDALPQMYAEALADFQAGEKAYPSPEEQKRLFTPEQAKRGMQEPFEDILLDWVKTRMVPFSMAEAARDGLNLTADKLTPAIVTRLGIVLKKLGCGRKEQRLAADPGERRLYLSPQMMALEMRGTVPAKEEVDHGYI
jgi:predicted P-loop ATPase